MFATMERAEAQFIVAARVLVALAVYVLLSCLHALALDPSLDLSQYAHRSYREGFLRGAVFAITQTPDGYLWLGTPFGVFHFDGVRAVPLPLPPGQQLPSPGVATLLTARDGTLWIGTQSGLASWKNGQLTQYPAVASRSIVALVQDHDGTVWAGGFVGATATLCAIRDGSTTCYGDDGSLGAMVSSLYQDSHGSLWVGAATGLWRWRPGPPTRVLSTPVNVMGNKVTSDDQGSGLLFASDSLRQIVGTRATVLPLPGLPSSIGAENLLRDRDGGLWIGTVAHGIVHSYAGKTSTFTDSDGLSSNEIYALFEDHEGTIWVATSEGLDRFRQLPITTLTVKQGISNATTNSVLVARDDSVWIGTGDGLNHWQHGRVTVYRKQSNPGLPDDNIGSMFEDERGRLWVSGIHGLAIFENGKFNAVPAAPAGTNNAIVGDYHGGLWLSLWANGTGYGLAHLVDRKIVENVSWRKLGGGPGTGLVPDPDGGVWTGLLSGGLAYYRAGQVRNLPLTDDRGIARKVLDISRDSDGSMWVSTETGLSRIQNGRVSTLTTANGLPCDTVHWIIEDNASSYWLYTRCGLVRIARADMDAWIADPKRTVRPTTFDLSDGIRLVSILKGLRPAAAKTSDGKIWFVNGFSALSYIDPSHIRVNTLPPPVHIEQVMVDGKAYGAIPNLRLPPHVRDMVIDYTALSLVTPDKVRFRFKLEGQDPNWREVVNDREVQYSNLAPGNYRFRVTACNNSGVWNETGDELAFSIAPAYYQTRWFLALCAAAVLALLWAAYQFRVRQLAYQFNLTVEARVSERTRIARDLHDTLLQSFQALLPIFQAALYKLPESAVEARKTLEMAVDRATDAITEGRDAVQGLRMSAVEKNDLAQAIRTIAEELATAENPEHPTPVEVLVEGPPRNLHPILRDEVYRLATEALRNAFRHAAAQQIEVEIRYDEKYLRLRVRDDGKGISPEVLRGDGRAGHYGLPGMKERAQLVGGKLTIWSEVDSGTEIELIIPASRAYIKPTREFWYFGKRSATKSEVKETTERE